MEPWLVVRCPLCRGVVGEMFDLPGAMLRARCKSRHCRDKPRLTWVVSGMHTLNVLTMDVDRREAAGVA